MKMGYVLFAALAAGAAFGGLRELGGASQQPPEADSTATAALADHGEMVLPDEEGAASSAIEGEVLEVIDVPQYSYLRLGEKGATGTWVAVPTAGLSVGGHARVRDSMKMEGFTSTSLKRTFPVIYFGTLDDGRATATVSPPAAGKSTHANRADMGADPDHAMKTAHQPLGAIDVKPVSRAEGPNAKTVAEVVAQRKDLAGKAVRIHGTVVKSTPSVLGRTYLHLRDGSGDAAAGTNDVAVTTEATPAVGDTIVVEGVAALDRDIGAGYRFPTIVENAKILAQ
jgi:hypothetical protein